MEHIELIPMIAMVTTTVMVVFIVYFVTRSRQRRVEAQMQMQSRLIDRFGSSPELVEFLHSPAGKEFVQGVQAGPKSIAQSRILSGFTRAIVLSSVGVAFIVLAFAYADEFMIPAAILTSLGIGYLLATFVSYKLAGKLGSGDASNGMH